MDMFYKTRVFDLFKIILTNKFYYIGKFLVNSYRCMNV